MQPLIVTFWSAAWRAPVRCSVVGDCVLVAGGVVRGSVPCDPGCPCAETPTATLIAHATTIADTTFFMVTSGELFGRAGEFALTRSSRAEQRRNQISARLSCARPTPTPSA